MKLEELARQSSHDARVSVAHLDLPPIGEDRRNRSWTTPVFAAAGIAAVVVAGLVVVNQLNTGNEAVSDDDVLPPVVEVPHLALPPDSGWTVTIASNAEDFAGRGLDSPTFAYYGVAGADDPYADGDLLIATYAAPSGAEAELPSEGRDVEVRGTTGRVSSGVDAGLPADSTGLEWIERDSDGNSVQVILVSQRFDDQRLLAIAEALTIDPASVKVTPGDDLGLERLASAPGTPFDALASSTEGSFVGYERDGGSEFLVLSSGRGDIARQLAVLQWWMPEVTPTTVNGRPAYVSTGLANMPGSGRPVIWAPSDGIIANLTYFGSNENLDLLSLAESVVELDESEWDALVAEFAASPAGADDLDVIYGEGSGSFAETEYAWALGLQGDDLCFHVSEGLGGYGSCRPRAEVSPPEGSAMTIDNSFGEQLGNVVIVADPSVEAVVEVEGRYTVERVDADGVSWFVAIGDTAIQPSFDVIVDGEVVATVEAAVEAVAEEVGAPSPIFDPAVLADLGLGDLEPVVAADHGNELWQLGVRDDEQCIVLVVDGRSEAICQPLADIAVFGPFEGPDGVRSFVSAIVPDECGDRIWVEGVDLPYGATAGGSHMVFTVAGSITGANLTIEGGTDGPASVALPTPSGTASFPIDPCSS